MSLSVISADVPEPLWDQTKQVMVMPLGLSERQMYKAMIQLMCERGECGHEDSSPDHMSASG